MPINFEPETSTATIDFEPEVATKFDFEPESPVARTEAAVAQTQDLAVSQIASNAKTAAIETAKSFIPRSVEQAAGMATPVVGAVHEVKRTYNAVKDWIRGVPLDEIEKRHFPEAVAFGEADKTPAFSKERFQVGFETLANMGMAAAAVKGLTKATGATSVKENVAPETQTELTIKQPEPIPKVGEITENVQQPLKSEVSKTEGNQIAETNAAPDEQGRTTPRENVGESPVQEQVVSFTTSKGSVYQVHEDGTTTRNKAPRPEHPGDFGPQERSHVTFYVGPGDLPYIGEIQSRGGPKKILAEQSPGNWGVKYLEGKDAGKFERRTVTEVEATPSAGMYPVEVWDGGRKFHFGNEITKIEQKVANSGSIPEPQRVTSIKNEQVDAERAQRNQPPLMRESAKDFGEAWSEFERRQDADPTYQDRLIKELGGKPRAIEDHEVAALTHRKVDLNNQLDTAATELAKAYTEGRTDVLSDLDARANTVLGSLNELDRVTTSVGTATSRGLNARKMMVAEDFSLARMIAKKQIAKGGEPLTPPEIAKIKKQADTIEGFLKKIDTRLKAAKTRTANLATEKRISTAIGDFGKPPKSELVADKELNFLRADLELAKREFQAGLEKDRWNRMNVFQKGKRLTGKTYDAARLLMTTGEFSFILRQGKIAMASRPIRTLKAVPDAIRSMRSERVANSIQQEIVNHPDYKFAARDKLAITDESTPLSRQEELTMGQWGEKIPVVSAFNRAARTFLNKVRWDTYRSLRNSLPPELRTPENTRQFAMFANESTGRGGLGKYGEPAAVGLARGLFSPRYLVSRFQLALGHSMWGGTRASRIAIAREYGRALIGLGIYYTALKTYFDRDGNGAVVEYDPRSSNFGKVVIGNTSIDPLAGLAQISTYTGRSIAGETKTFKGNIKPIRGENIPYGGDDWWDVTGQFARTKLHPVPGTIANLLSGRDLVGNAVSPETESAKLFAPITYLDVYQALREQDVDDSTALGLLAFLGEGLQTRQPRPSHNRRHATR